MKLIGELSFWMEDNYKYCQYWSCNIFFVNTTCFAFSTRLYIKLLAVSIWAQGWRRARAKSIIEAKDVQELETESKVEHEMESKAEFYTYPEPENPCQGWQPDFLLWAQFRRFWWVRAISSCWGTDLTWSNFSTPYSCYWDFWRSFSRTHCEAVVLGDREVPIFY